jgi:serine protease Do
VVTVLCLGKSGSGFVINGEEGYVVTNFHVIESEQDISVILYVRDGRAGDAGGDPAAGEAESAGESPAEPAGAAGATGNSGERHGLRKLKLDQVRIVAMNPFFDLALLKIEDSRGVRLKTAYLGDFARVSAGDPVFAIGSPLGLERTVTEGIVSNRNRALSGQLLIQTTAPINPGNSGGPLFNDRGEVIGVTSLKIVFADSLGFAIPIHYVKDFLRNRDSFAFDKDHPNTGVRYLAPPPKRAPTSNDSSETPPEGKRSPALSGTPAGGAPNAEKSQRRETRKGRL